MASRNIFPVERRGSDSVKWGQYGKDVLPLWVADTDFVSPQEVIQALRQRVEHGVFGYPMDPPELGELVAECMMKRYKWKVSPQDMMFIPGVVPGFNLVCQAVTQPGESLLVQPPIYSPILKAADNAGARSLQVELVRRKDGAYEVDFDAFEAAIEKDTRCFLLCNPHNPVGKVFSRAELERMADICIRHQMVICSDEIHSDLIFSGYQHTPIASLSEEIAQSTATLIAPSKTYNIAGLECAVLICQNRSLLKKFRDSRRGLLGHANVLGLTAAVAAYKYGETWLKQMMEILEENRDFLAASLQDKLPQIKMRKPEATYLAWMDCEGLSLGVEPYQFFLDKAGVALNRGEEFGKGGKNFVRLNFGCTKEILEDALERMARAIANR